VPKKGCLENIPGDPILFAVGGIGGETGPEKIGSKAEKEKGSVIRKRLCGKRGRGEECNELALRARPAPSTHSLDMLVHWTVRKTDAQKI